MERIDAELAGLVALIGDQANLRAEHDATIQSAIVLLARELHRSGSIDLPRLLRDFRSLAKLLDPTGERELQRMAIALEEIAGP
jgi:hypothetical protein